MYKINPSIEYLDQKSLDRIYDEIALNQYLETSREVFTEAPSLPENLELLLRDLLENLSEERKFLLHFRFWEDLSEPEISYKMGLSVEEVRLLLQDTLDLLKERILAVLTPRIPTSYGEALCMYE